MRYEKFMPVVNGIATMSKDPKRKVGALIITPDGSPISWGFNGLARGIMDDHRLDDVQTKLRLIVHAEINAIFNAARVGVSTKGGIMICTLFPCVGCSNAIIQAGITTVYCPNTPILEPNSKWSVGASESRELLHEAGVNVEFFTLTQER